MPAHHALRARFFGNTIRDGNRCRDFPIQVLRPPRRPAKHLGNSDTGPFDLRYCERRASPLISVVMPDSNHERFIGEALRRVIEQTCDGLELIVVDDGFTNGTAGIVTSFSDRRLRNFFMGLLFFGA